MDGIANQETGELTFPLPQKQIDSIDQLSAREGLRDVIISSEFVSSQTPHIEPWPSIKSPECWSVLSVTPLSLVKTSRPSISGIIMSKIIRSGF